MVHVFSLLLVAVAGSSLVCGGASAVERAYATWLHAYEARDLGGTMSFFDRSVAMSFAGSPDSDYAALRSGYAKEFASPGTSRWVPVFEAPLVDDRLAIAASRWKLYVNGRDTIHNRGIDVLRCDGGTWRIVRSMNYIEWKARTK